LVKVLRKARLIFKSGYRRDYRTYYENNKEAMRLRNKLGVTLTEAKQILEKDKK